jgi:hypothetical protein
MMEEVSLLSLPKGMRIEQIQITEQDLVKQPLQKGLSKWVRVFASVQTSSENILKSTIGMRSFTKSFRLDSMNLHLLFSATVRMSS